MAQSVWFSQDGERCRSQFPPYHVFLSPLDQPWYFSLVMLSKCGSSPDLQGIPPAFCGVWQWKLHSHLHLPYPGAGWWSCGNRPNSLRFKISLSQKVENSTDAGPAQGLFPFSKHCLLIPAVHSPQAPHHHLFLLLHI